jgi:transcriptional regulator with XRE-family HTH domain
MTQTRLAKLAKLHPSHVSLIESGGRVPSLDTLEAISSALKVPLYLLILVASERSDLNGIDERQAKELGLSLLRLLTEYEAP